MTLSFSKKIKLFCFSGCSAIVVGHPFDTVKVNLQTQDIKNPTYKGTFHCFRTIFAKEGIRGIYKGISSPLAGVAAINAIVFGVYGNCQRNSSDPNSLFTHFVAGSAAGFAQSFLCSPIELAKSRVQLSKTPLTPLECFKKIYATEGLKGTFRGLGITIVREIPAYSSYFVTYEWLTRNDRDEPVTTFTMLMAGGIAGVVSWCGAYPIDVVKTRMQMDGVGGVVRFSSSWDCVKKCVAEEGYRFLFRGFTPTLLRAFPVNAACFTVVTWTMRICQGDFRIEIGSDQEMQIM